MLQTLSAMRTNEPAPPRRTGRYFVILRTDIMNGLPLMAAKMRCYVSYPYLILTTRGYESMSAASSFDDIMTLNIICIIIIYECACVFICIIIYIQYMYINIILYSVGRI